MAESVWQSADNYSLDTILMDTVLVPVDPSERTTAPSGQVLDLPWVGSRWAPLATSCRSGEPADRAATGFYLDMAHAALTGANRGPGES